MKRRKAEYKNGRDKISEQERLESCAEQIDVKTEWEFKMWSHELDPTDLQNVNNLNFSGSNRKENSGERCQKKQTMKGQLRAKSER